MRRQGFGALLTDEQWAVFLKAGATRVFPDGEPIMRQGDREGVVYMLAEGTVKVSVVRPDGTESLLALRGSGEALGEFSALSGLPRTATVTPTGGDCLTRALTSAHFRLLVGRMDLHRALWEHVVKRQSEGESQRAEIVALPSGRRLAATLLRLTSVLGTHVPGTGSAGSGGDGEVRHGAVLRVGLSQKELGDWIGMSRASVAAEFGRLRSMGIIRTGRRYVSIRDLDRLREVAHGEP